MLYRGHSLIPHGAPASSRFLILQVVGFCWGSFREFLEEYIPLTSHRLFLIGAHFGGVHFPTVLAHVGGFLFAGLLPFAGGSLEVLSEASARKLGPSRETNHGMPMVPSARASETHMFHNHSTSQLFTLGRNYKKAYIYIYVSSPQIKVPRLWFWCFGIIHPR